MLKRAFAAAAITAVLFTGHAMAQQCLPPGSFQVAQGGGSCQSWFNMCSSRCKTRMPDDKNCTSDHCSPKLSECRQTGCWQEGKLYGGGKTCGLSK